MDKHPVKSTSQGATSQKEAYPKAHPVSSVRELFLHTQAQLCQLSYIWLKQHHNVMNCKMLKSNKNTSIDYAPAGLLCNSVCCFMNLYKCTKVYSWLKRQRNDFDSIHPWITLKQSFRKHVQLI